MAFLSAITAAFDEKMIDDALAEGRTLPDYAYFEPAIYEFEIEQIWARSWQLAGARSNLANPGDYIVCQPGSVPVVVTRSLDGDLHGFVNICRHRGYPVALEDGDRKTELQCRYHGWRYNLDGTLRDAPGCQQEPGFDPGHFSLSRVAVDTWGEAVFVNPDPSARPFREMHPKFEEFAASRELDPEFSDYRFFRRYTYDIDANWKLWADNNLECYHCPTIHPTSFSAGFDVNGDVETTEVDHLFSFRFRPTGLIEGGDKGVGYRSVQVFPGFLITQQDHVALIAQASPTGPESTRFVLYMYADPDSDESVVEEWADIWNRTFLEDVEAVAVQHNALRSRRLPYGRLIRTSEKPVAYLQALIWQVYRNGANGSSKTASET